MFWFLEGSPCFQEIGRGWSLRWGWVFLERTRILSGIQFTTHFINFFVVETKRSVSSTVNVVLTLRTCGLRTSRAADRKCRVIKNYSSFSKRICHTFLILNCRGDWDLGWCTFWVLAKENRCAMATSKKNCRPLEKSEFGILQQFFFRNPYSHGWQLRNASIKKHILTFLFLTFFKAKKLVLIIWVS